METYQQSCNSYVPNYMGKFSNMSSSKNIQESRQWKWNHWLDFDWENGIYQLKKLMADKDAFLLGYVDETEI